MYYALGRKLTKDGPKTFIFAEAGQSRSEAEASAREWANTYGYTLEGVYKYVNYRKSEGRVIKNDNLKRGR